MEVAVSAGCGTPAVGGTVRRPLPSSACWCDTARVALVPTESLMAHTVRHTRAGKAPRNRCYGRHTCVSRGGGCRHAECCFCRVRAPGTVGDGAGRAHWGWGFRTRGTRWCPQKGRYLTRKGRSGTGKRGNRRPSRNVQDARPTRRPGTAGVEVCNRFQSGKASNGEQCRFAHVRKPCFYFANTGFCRRGNSCIFAHTAPTQPAVPRLHPQLEAV